MDDSDDQVNPADPFPLLRECRLRVASGEITLEEAARELAQEGAPDLSEDNARLLLAPAVPNDETDSPELQIGSERVGRSFVTTPDDALGQYRAGIDSGELTLDEAARELAAQGGPDFTEDDARTLLTPPSLTPLDTFSLPVTQSWGQLGLGEPTLGHTAHRSDDERHPFTPAFASAGDSRFRRTIRRRKAVATLGFLVGALGASTSAIHSALNGQGWAAFWAGAFAALVLYTLVLTRQYLSLVQR